MIIFDIRSSNLQLGTNEDILLTQKGWEAYVGDPGYIPTPWVLIISHSTLFSFFHLTFAPHMTYNSELEMCFLEKEEN